MTVSANPRSARREPACHESVCSCRALAEPNHSGRYRQVRKPQWLGSRTTRAKRGPRLRRLFKQEPIYEQSAMRTLREQWQKWPSKRARQQLKIEQLRLRRPGVRHEPALANPPERVFSRRWPDDENSMTMIGSDSSAKSRVDADDPSPLRQRTALELCNPLAVALLAITFRWGTRRKVRRRHGRQKKAPRLSAGQYRGDVTLLRQRWL